MVLGEAPQQIVLFNFGFTFGINFSIVHTIEKINIIYV